LNANDESLKKWKRKLGLKNTKSKQVIYIFFTLITEIDPADARKVVVCSWH
jgi:hypothetical protein